MKFRSLNAINSLKLSKSLKEKIGMMETVKTLREGRLLLFCNDNRQEKV